MYLFGKMVRGHYTWMPTGEGNESKKAFFDFKYNQVENREVILRMRNVCETIFLYLIGSILDNLSLWKSQNGLGWKELKAHLVPTSATGRDTFH